MQRIYGVRANASCMSHAELDEALELDDGNPQEFGQDYVDLYRKLRNLKVIGGCCGTDHRHIEEICRSLDIANREPGKQVACIFFNWSIEMKATNLEQSPCGPDIGFNCPELTARIGGVLGTIVCWNRRHRARMQMAGTDSRILRDFGISTADTFIETNKSFWEA